MFTVKLSTSSEYSARSKRTEKTDYETESLDIVHQFISQHDQGRMWAEVDLNDNDYRHWSNGELHIHWRKTPGHGGKRKGAGRPRMVKYERARPVSVTLTRKQHEALRDLLHVMSEHEPVGEHNREKLSKLNRSQLVGACIELVHSKVASKRGTDLELRDDLTLFL